MQPGVAKRTPLGLRYIDVVLVLVAAPILLLVGVPAAGYGVGATTWILLRALGVAVDHGASAIAGLSAQMTLGLGYRLARVSLLVTAIVLARRGAGKDNGLAALTVIVFAFTIQLAFSIVNRPRSHH